MQVYESGPEDGIPVVLIHGNLSTGRFYEHLFDGAPARYRLIAPDMRGFGDTERVPLDATRGLRDWADDTRALLRRAGHHGAAAPRRLVDRRRGDRRVRARAPGRVADLHRPGRPVRLRRDASSTARRTSTTSPAPAAAPATRSSPRGWRPATRPPTATPRRATCCNSSYWRAEHREPPEREDMLLGEILKSVTGDDGYPGDTTTSEHWPGVAPGTRGILNALSPKYCNWAGDRRPRPQAADPVDARRPHDIVIADGSPWEMGTLGSLGVVPGWPGADVVPAAADGRADPRRARALRRRAAGACR